ncbi:MAG: DUF975 family protein [Bacteroides sp.]
MKQNSELRAQARQVLSGSWGMAVIATLVYMAIVGLIGIIPLVNSIGILLSLPLGWGMMILFLNLYRGDKISIEPMFDGFKDYLRILGTEVLVYVYAFLWSLLLIIPGIVKSYSYGMTYYILKDNPELSFNAAIEKSMSMMDGKKMKLFLLDLGFIGWHILCLITCGIGYLWLVPYVYTAHAAFYEDIKEETVVIEA